MTTSAPAETPSAPVDVNIRSVSLTILAITAAMYLLQWAQEVFIPIVVSVLISYALEPIVAWLARRHVARIIGAGVVVALSCGLLGYTAYALTDDAVQLVAQLPEAAQKLRLTLRSPDNNGTIQQVQRAAEEIQKTADETAGRNPVPRGVQRVQVEEPAIDVRQYLTWGSTSVIAFGGQGVLVVFFVFFLLASGDLFKRKLVKLAGPSLAKKKITVQILDEINVQIERFLLVRLVTSVVVGVVTWIAFRSVGLEQAALWAIAAGVFNTIPYIGPVLVAGATFVVAFMQFGTLPMATWVSGLSLAITSLEGWLLTPWLTSRTAQTNEVSVFIALLFWSFVWGVWGALLAVPMLVAFKAYCDRIDDLKPVGELLGQ